MLSHSNTLADPTQSRKRFPVSSLLLLHGRQQTSLSANIDYRVSSLGWSALFSWYRDALFSLLTCLLLQCSMLRFPPILWPDTGNINETTRLGEAFSALRCVPGVECWVTNAQNHIFIEISYNICYYFLESILYDMPQENAWSNVWVRFISSTFSFAN